MRIISGTHKGRRITPDKNFSARPTTDFAKENLFNILNNMIDFNGLKVLDLFSGTGSISYEFASRGAKEIVIAELNYKHYVFIKKTAKELGFNNFKVFKVNAFTACRKLKGQKFDMIFADPPYKLETIEDIPNAIFDNELLADNGLAILEHSEKYDFSKHKYFLEHREYGSVNFSIFKIK